MNDRQQQWQNILRITRELKQMFDDENWQQMPDLESKRLRLMQDFFAEPVPEEEAASLAEEIKQIMQSDQALMDAGRAKQKELSGAVQKLTSNRKAIHAYNQMQK